MSRAPTDTDRADHSLAKQNIQPRGCHRRDGAIHSHLERGDLSDGLVFDAVRVRLIEIGEAVEALPAQLLANEPALPWTQIAGMRDRLAHRYFDTSHAILAATVSEDLPELDIAVRRLLLTVDDNS